MTTGMYICNLCEYEGRPPGERFKVPADEIGIEIMKQHLKEHDRMRTSVSKNSIPECS